MRAAGTVARAGVEFALQGADERAEEIEEQTIGAEHDVAQLILHQRAENDGPHALFGGRAVDRAHGFVRLVNAGHKWQSHGPKFDALELCHQAVAQCFGGHSRLVGYEENGSRLMSPKCFTAGLPSKRYVAWP